ncbi:MAG TPA: hypothetical protein VF712_18775 [Thermoleophilaceae bacterium]
MLSATLDTSCAQNFLSPLEEADAALIQVIRAGIAGRLDLAVSDEAFEEVARTPDLRLREERLKRLRAFGPVALPAERHGERDALAGRLEHELFPGAQPGSRAEEHNRRDCRQLATHHLIGRDVFVTNDRALHAKRGDAAKFGIAITDAHGLAQQVAAQPDAFGLQLSSITLRAADRDRDEAGIRRVLEPLAADYPDFSGWLTSRLRKADTRITVGEYEGRLAAAAISVRKDERVLKLAAFYVDAAARDSALGPHLLWSEMRGWVQDGFEKAYVTISSRHADLIGFFAGFGFLVEGVSARRYQDDTVEFVLGKHLLRARVEDAELDKFAEGQAPVLFALPGGANVPADRWAIAPAATTPRFEWDHADGALVARDDESEVRRWTVAELERLLHPARFALSGRRALVVPIHRRWADSLVEYVGQQGQLSRSVDARRLLLRTDNAYYCYPKSLDAAQPGAPLLLYLTDPAKAIIGEARVFDAVIDDPDDLFVEFGGMGVYQPENIRGHVIRGGEHDGHALALRFSMYVPYPRPVPFAEVRALRGDGFNPQGLTTIGYEEYEAIRRSGEVEW